MSRDSFFDHGFLSKVLRFIATGNLLPLREQHLVDCNWSILLATVAHGQRLYLPRRTPCARSPVTDTPRTWARTLCSSISGTSSTLALSRLARSLMATCSYNSVDWHGPREDFGAVESCLCPESGANASLWVGLTMTSPALREGLQNLENDHSDRCLTGSTRNGTHHRVLPPVGCNGVDPGGLHKNSKKVDERGRMQKIYDRTEKPIVYRSLAKTSDERLSRICFIVLYFVAEKSFRADSGLLL